LKIKYILLIFLITVITYSNSLGGEFVYDDEYFIAKNVMLRNIANVPYFFVDRSTVAFSGLSEDVYRPLTTVTFALNYFFGKVDSFGYHLINVLLHASNAILLFIFLSMLFDNMLFALFASLFFACHPVQTEVVSWISGRSSVLFLFFYLASLIFYAKSYGSAKRAYFICSVIFCALALFSKEMAVTLPVMLIVYDIHFSGKVTVKRRLYRYIPYFALAAFYVLARSNILNRMSQCEWWGGSPYYTFLTMMRVFADYIKLLIFPAKLCAFYAINISTSIAETPVIASLILLMVIMGSIPFMFRRSRLASFGICLFFVTLIPVSNIVPLKALMAERFLYLPSIGFCVALAVLLEKTGAFRLKGILDNARIIAAILAVTIIAAYASRTIARNEDWGDEMAITRSIIEVSPMNPWAYNALAAVYLSKGKNSEAVKPLIKSIALAVDYAAPKSALGFTYRELGRFDESVKMLKEALAITPDALETINSLGLTYARMRKYEDAAREFEKCIKLDPIYLDARLNLGATYERLWRYDKAAEEYSKIVDMVNNPKDIAIAYIRIGDVYRRTKDEAKAKEYYNKAFDICDRGSDMLRKVIEDRLKGHLPDEK
jgi:tetratricopeptide (TPR) repeat protein